MAVVSRVFQKNITDPSKYQEWKREVDYFINRLVGANRFITANVFRDRFSSFDFMVAYIWFREADDERIEQEFTDLGQLEFIDDDAKINAPGLSDANSTLPLTIDELTDGKY